MILDSAGKRNATIWIISFAIFTTVVVSVLTQKHAIMFLPVAFILTIGIFLKPQFIPVFLIISFFSGIPIKQYGSISIKIADVLFLLLILAVYSHRNKEKTELRFEGSIKHISIFFFVFFISCFLSILLNLHTKQTIDIATSIWYLISLFEVIVIILLFSQNRFYYLKEILISTFLLMAFLEQVMAALQYFQLGTNSIDQMRWVNGTFTHHAMLGNMMILAVSLCLYRFMNSSSLKLKYLYGTGVVLNIYTMIISGSRSGLLGLLISLVIFTLVKFKFKKRYFLYIGAMIVFGTLILYLTPLKDIINSTIKNQHTRTIDLSSYLRLLIWKGTIFTFVNNGIIQKLFGMGIGNFETIVHPYVLLSSSRHAAGAHNNFLHVLTETGIFGFIIFMLLFGTILYELAKKSKLDKLAFSFLFATVALLSSGMTQETFWFQPDFATFWICYAIFLSLTFNYKSNTSG